MEEIKHYWLYVLELKSHKFYVGITTRTPKARYEQHLNGFAGAAWTRKYPPVGIHYQRDLGMITKGRAEAYENRVVRRYIDQYGIDNVRGGDIRLAEDLVIRFGWWWSKKDWEGLVAVVFLLVCFIAMGIYAISK